MPIFIYFTWFSLFCVYLWNFQSIENLENCGEAPHPAKSAGLRGSTRYIGIGTRTVVLSRYGFLVAETFRQKKQSLWQSIGFIDLNTTSTIFFLYRLVFAKTKTKLDVHFFHFKISNQFFIGGPSSKKIKMPRYRPSRTPASPAEKPLFTVNQFFIFSCSKLSNFKNGLVEGKSNFFCFCENQSIKKISLIWRSSR